MTNKCVVRLELGKYTLSYHEGQPHPVIVTHENHEMMSVSDEKWNEIFDKLWEDY